MLALSVGLQFVVGSAVFILLVMSIIIENTVQRLEHLL